MTRTRTRSAAAQPGPEPVRLANQACRTSALAAIIELRQINESMPYTRWSDFTQPIQLWVEAPSLDRPLDQTPG